MTDCLHPEIEVELIGQDGNGFLIASRVRSALFRAGHKEDASAFFNEALTGDYDHLLQTVHKYVSAV
jgi:hypothetical protein